MSPTVTVTELPEPELDERTMLTAVRKASVGSSVLLPETATNDQVGQTVVSWRSGPNPYPFDYSVKCYAVDSADADVATCQDIDSLTPVGDVVSGKVPMIHSKVDVTYDGFTDKYVDCYIRVSGAAGTKSKCTYAGRATIPDATTITCANLAAGTTFTVNSVEYYVASADNDSSDPKGINNIATADLETTCTSLVTDLSSLINARTGEQSTFNPDISKWDTSSVVNMRYAFTFTAVFNADIGAWDVSNVNDMDGTFEAAASFNRDISGWDTGAVTGMVETFGQAGAFDQDLSGWEINPAITGVAQCGLFLNGANTWINGIGPAGYPALPSECLPSPTPGR